MENNQTIVRWSDLHNKNVVDPKEGKVLGKVEDFFFKEGSNAIYALCVRTRLYGDLSLPVTGIAEISKDRVSVRNAQMLLKALPPLGRGQTLVSRKAVSEKGNDLGAVKDVVIGIEPVTAMRVAAVEIARGSSSTQVLGTDGIIGYSDENNSVIVQDQAAKKLR